MSAKIRGDSEPRGDPKSKRHVDAHSLEAHAVLSGVLECSAHKERDELVEVGVVADDSWIFAAELQDDGG